MKNESMAVIARLRTVILDDYLANDAANCIEKLEARIAKLKAGYVDAIDDICAWGSYSSDYFKCKHGLSGCVLAHRKVLNEITRLKK